MKYRNILLIILIIFSFSCEKSHVTPERRAKRAEKSEGDILIAAAAPWELIANELGVHSWQGLELAVEEINSSGGVLGRKIHIIKKDDKGSVVEGRRIAAELADNLDVVAVIGHFNSSVSIAASIIYEYSGILMITPSSQDPELTARDGFKKIFRLTVTTSDFAAVLAEYAYKQGFRKIIIYNEQDVYGRNFANVFAKRAHDLGIDIIDRRSYVSGSKDIFFEKDLFFWKTYYDFDAVFIGGVNTDGNRIIIQAEKLGINVPFIGPDNFSSLSFLNEVENVSNKIIIPVQWYPEDYREKTQKFIEAFQQKYGFPPDSEAASWYETAKLVAYTMNQSGTTNPDRVAESLRSIKALKGVFGPITFDRNGDLIENYIKIGIIKNGELSFYESNKGIQ